MLPIWYMRILADRFSMTFSIQAEPDDTYAHMLVIFQTCSKMGKVWDYIFTHAKGTSECE